MRNRTWKKSLEYNGSSAVVQKPHLKSPHCAASLGIPTSSHHCLTLLSFPSQMSSAATGPQSEQKEDILSNSPVSRANNALCYKRGEFYGELSRMSRTPPSALPFFSRKTNHGSSNKMELFGFLA
ncbi:hypothetical protein AV530_020084 [Patagioenas fasciata monilis]|uniref:Uncharacterized protein n=1 Tax=Patagioenas fasciata monilis TaxID=372326 RepID=A0A1V4JI00_PATFA|nr:hypothetical protein AV530_020084 [Patagioenas fasciata monilis]